MGTIHAPKRVTPRLARMLDLLKDGSAYTTREIIQKAEVCAVSSCAKELRVLGYDIQCRRETIDRRLVFKYRLVGAYPGRDFPKPKEPGAPLYPPDPDRSRVYDGEGLSWVLQEIYRGWSIWRGEDTEDAEGDPNAQAVHAIQSPHVATEAWALDIGEFWPELAEARAEIDRRVTPEGQLGLWSDAS